MELITQLHRGALMFEAEAVMKELNNIEGITATASRKGIIITMNILIKDDLTNNEILELGMLIGQTLMLRHMR